MPDSDADLLNAFARHRDEAAFGLLARRYLGLVFHSALRRTGNRPMAEEISQNILCALAAKSASLARHPDRLPAWLHRATLYESTKAMRSEASRRRHEQHAEPPASSTESPWTDALPHLDVALDHLGESDRTLLLLHFFEGRSFPRIAESLGKSTAAVQKQSQRALEKLAGLLRGKGVALSLSVIATGLSSELAKAAPISMVQSATAAALAGSATLPTGTVLLMTLKSKALIPVALLVAAMPLALQEAAISKAEQRQEALRSRTTVTIVNPKPARSSPGSSSLSSSLDLLVLFDEQTDARLDGQQRQDDFLEKLAALDSTVLIRLIRETAAYRTRVDLKGQLLEFLVSALGKKDPQLAVTTVVDSLEPGATFAKLMTAAEVAKMFGRWAWQDPVAAGAWLKDQESSGKLKGPFSRRGDGMEVPMKARLLGVMIARGLPGYEAWMQGVDRKESLNLLLTATSEGFSRIADEGGNESALAVSFLQVIRHYPEERERISLLRHLADNVSRSPAASLDHTTSFFQRAALAPDEREIIARRMALMRLATPADSDDPAKEARTRSEVAAWLGEVSPDAADAILEEAAEAAAQAKHDRAKSALEIVRRQPAASDQSLAHLLGSHDFSGQHEAALEQAERIQDPILKAATIRKLQQQETNLEPGGEE